MAVPSKKAAWVIDKVWVWEEPVVTCRQWRGGGRRRQSLAPSAQRADGALMSAGRRSFPKLFLSCFSQTRRKLGQARWFLEKKKKKSKYFVSQRALILF